MTQGFCHDTVHIVRVNLDTWPADPSALSDAERERADRFVFDDDRRRYVAVHSAMREALGRCVGQPAAALRFSSGPRGKPKLAANSAVRFNLSHAAERAVLALALGREVGVDIEAERPIDAVSVAERFFSPAERAALLDIAPDDRIAAFYRGWTRKESFIKATGDGLAYPLDAFDVSLDRSGPQLLLACRANPGNVERWRVVTLAGEMGYACALTVEGSDWRLVDWDSVEAFMAAAGGTAASPE